MWKIEILTIFPAIFDSFLKTSLVNKAITRGLLSVATTDIRDFSAPPHHKVDDSPYGGGAGMVMMAEPLVKAIESAKGRLPEARVILLSPSGPRFTQSKAAQLSKHDSLIFVCGRYEGIDQRAIDLAVDEELSVGDFVVMGGEVPTMLVIPSPRRGQSCRGTAVYPPRGVPWITGSRRAPLWQPQSDSGVANTRIEEQNVKSTRAVFDHLDLHEDSNAYDSPRIANTHL
jgi:hypothetical protein